MTKTAATERMWPLMSCSFAGCTPARRCQVCSLNFVVQKGAEIRVQIAELEAERRAAYQATQATSR